MGARLWNVAVTPDSYGPERPWYTLRLCVLPLRALRYAAWIKWGVYPALYLSLIGAGVVLLRRRRAG